LAVSEKDARHYSKFSGEAMQVTKFVSTESSRDNRTWYCVDADGKVLGRLAARIAMALMGKDKADYTPNVDNGSFVIVTNAGKVKVTGQKLDKKVYYYYTGYAGGLKCKNMGEMMERKPEQLIRLAVRRMMPKTALGKQMMRKLRIYRGSDHPHGANKPMELPM